MKHNQVTARVRLLKKLEKRVPLQKPSIFFKLLLFLTFKVTERKKKKLDIQLKKKI